MNKLELWFESIKSYMDLTHSSPIYTRSLDNNEDNANLLDALGFTKYETFWYDGIVFSGTRDNIKYCSAWCTSEHSSCHPDYSFFIAIAEASPESVIHPMTSLYILDSSKYNVFKEGIIVGDIPDEFINFQTKLLKMCDDYNNLGSTNKMKLYPRFTMHEKYETCKELWYGN